MITFYPRDIGRWREEYSFEPDITLTPKLKTNHKIFHSRDEFIGYLKERGVSLTDPENPLRIVKHEGTHPTLGQDAYVVVQWTVLGWIKDNYA